MSLPTEIRDAIVAELFYPAEDLWLGFATMDGVYRGWRSEKKQHTYPPVASISLAPELATLSKLRLVSREWNETVASMLSNHYWWALKFDKKASLERAANCCLSQRGTRMRNVRITHLSEALLFGRKYTFDSERQRNSPSPLLYTQRHTFEDMPLQREVAPQEYGLLRDILSYPNLVEGFSISFPEAVTFGSDHNEACCYNLQALDEMFSIIQVALKSDQFQHLRELHLEIPCTRDILRLSDAMSLDARRRLEHLRIFIMDATGQDGSSDFQSLAETSPQGVVDEASIEQRRAPSNLQVEFPNKDHQSTVWDFVVSCPNLKSLGIKATHCLDLDMLNWKRLPSSPGLRALSLHRVYASVASIIKLLAPSSNKSSPPLQFINLDDVKLHANSAGWPELFTYLHKGCPNLIVSRLDQLSYFQNHPRFEMYSINRPRAVRSRNGEDTESFIELYKYLVEKAHRIHFPDQFYT